MSKLVLTEEERKEIREMYRYIDYLRYKPKDKLEGVSYDKIDSIKKLMYYYSSVRFYRALNKLVGFETNSVYGPVPELYDVMRDNDIEMNIDKDGEVNLKLVKKDDE